MPYEVFLALRYLRVRRGRRGAAQVTALAALVGITCGVAALILATALANGFRDELQEKILRGTAHLTATRTEVRALRAPSQATRAPVQPTGGEGRTRAQPAGQARHSEARAGADWREATERLRRVEGVVEASATSYTGALLSGPGGASYAVLRGVEEDAPRTLAEIRRTLKAGAVETLFSKSEAPHGTLFREAPHDESPPAARPNNTGKSGVGANQLGFAAELGFVEDGAPVWAIVGAELAERTGLREVGDEGWIITGEKTDEAQGFSPRMRRVRVAGLFRSGLYDYDASWVYVPLRAAHEELGAASVISMEVTDIYETETVAARARRELGAGWTIVDWREANGPLFAALQLERRTVALIIALVMLVAALNITATLVIVVVERRGDIAVLSAMGARARSIMAVFVVEGAIVGATGAALGVALGLGACLLANHYELVRLPPDVYSLSAVTLRPHTSDVFLTALAAFALSLLATIYPARVAARLRPAAVLRYE